MPILKTASRVLPPPLRRRCRDFLIGGPAEFDASTYLRSRGAELEVTLETLVSDYCRTHSDIFFLQVGAFDGISTDSIYPLVDKYALRGVLIEPQQEFFEKLRSNYARFDPSRFAFINAAIAEADGTLPIYKIKSNAQGPEWLHGIASLDRDVLMRHGSTVPGLESLVEVDNVRCLTFTTLFSELKIEHVDILQIDAEGHDGIVLRLFDIPARKPAIVRFEHKHLTAQDYKSCLDVLINQDYKVALSGTDTLAYHAQL